MHNILGHFFLNVAFGLYLILYLPQLYHNARHQAFHQMSFMMHMMILQAYSCDLFYGLSKHMPWQYLCVSLVGLFCLLTQHLQWFFFRWKKHKNLDWMMLLMGVLCILWPMLLWYYFAQDTLQYKLQAWCSRVLFIIHFLPQIIKYRRNEDRQAISLLYLSLSITLSLCDLIAAVCLNWEMANQIGSLISLGLKSYLSFQIFSCRFNPRLSFLKTRSAR